MIRALVVAGFLAVVFIVIPVLVGTIIRIGRGGDDWETEDGDIWINPEYTGPPSLFTRRDDER